MVTTVLTDMSQSRDDDSIASLISRPSLHATGLILAVLTILLTLDALIQPLAPFDSG